MESSYFYANITAVYCSENDFMINFKNTAPVPNDTGKPETKNTLDTNISLSPVAYKKTLIAMQMQLKKYEDIYGEIKVKQMPVDLVQKK